MYNINVFLGFITSNSGYIVTARTFSWSRHNLLFYRLSQWYTRQGRRNGFGTGGGGGGGQFFLLYHTNIIKRIKFCSLVCL